MNKYLTLLVIALMLFSCKENAKNEAAQETSKQTENIENQETAYVSFGEKIEATNAINVSKMVETYSTLPVGDSLSTKLTAKVNSVCQVKGCWMKLDLGNNQEVMVRFKDYGFFMPMNIAGKEVVVDGVAFINEMSVEELKHYAEDAGKTEEEIAAITEPKQTYSFLANGVLLAEK